MSELITATTVMVASNVLLDSVAASAAVSTAASGVLAGAGIFGGVIGAVALGNMLVNLPVWKDLEKTNCVDLAGFVNAESFEQDFLAQTERNYAQLLQATGVGIPAHTFDVVAALAALDRSPLVGAVARERFREEVSEIANTAAKLPELAAADISTLRNRTADLVERSLTESRTRIADFVDREFRAALVDCGWTIKDEAHSKTGSAYVAVNSLGQRVCAHVERGGSITTDMAGFAGRDCESAAAKLFEALERRGILHKCKNEQPHFLFEGGPLAGRAANAAQILERSGLKTASPRKSTDARNGNSQHGGTSRTQVHKSLLIQRLRNHIS